MNSIKKLLFLFILSSIFLSLVIFLTNKKSDEEILNNKLTEIGIKFYENFYYDSFEKDLIMKYEKNGIKINLESLFEYSFIKDNYDLDIFNNDEYKCDLEKTMIIIYPETPYEKNNYNIKTILVCDFKS